jgi:nucleotide-binding universal stress UspA family protein
MFQNILVCLDGSKLAEQIFPYIEAQVMKFESKLTLLHIVDLPEVNVVEAGASYIDSLSQDARMDVSYNKAEAYLEEVSRPLRSKGIVTETAVVKAHDVGKAILDYAKKNNIDLIGMVTHGHGGLGKIVFGSVFERVLRDSGLPVLAVKPQKQ